MLSSRRIALSLGVACASLSAFASTALASGPATVTVRVEGLSETKLPSTTITTTTTPVVNDGNPEDECSGTSALGALQIATNGNWEGPWEDGQYFIDTIDGETHLYDSTGLSYYWSFWVNDQYEAVGACEQQLENGDRVLFFPECDNECPPGPSPTPLEIEAAPASNVNEPVDVIVKQYNMKGEPSPAAGAEITWSGGSETTNSQGDATLTFSTRGVYTLHVTGSEVGPPAVRTETTICVHNGNDGTCGTTAGSSSSSSSSSSSGTASGSVGVAAFSQSAPYTGPYALVADASGLINGHTYGRGRAPRLLAGNILAHSSVTSVSLKLRREYKSRCYSYNGTKERFVSTGCGAGSFFKVSSDASYSYLLPSALPPGRYVLDIQASDAAGNRTTLARGTSRIVFHVR